MFVTIVKQLGPNHNLFSVPYYIQSISQSIYPSVRLSVCLTVCLSNGRRET